jgi:hypothetical protein
MKPLVRLLTVCFLVLVSVPISHAQWNCLYATWDDSEFGNAIGTNTAAVGVIKSDMFVALASSWSGGTTTECFLLPYVGADSAKGRKYTYGYGSGVTGIFQTWTDGGFDQVSMFEVWKIKTTSDSLIYVANNDVDHNILVFKYTQDTITVVPVAGTGVYPRQQTGTNRIHGIDVDAPGYVYVCNDSSFGVTDDIKIYKPVTQWTASHTDAPVSTVNLPDGVYKGISVSPDGTLLFVSDYGNRRVLKYRGSPTTGYTPDAGFSFTLSPADTISSTAPAAPMGLAYLSPNNILAVVCHRQLGGTGIAYRYGRIYMLNPNNGAFISPDTLVHLIDAAQWNFLMSGGYQNRSGGTTPGNASGYASPYDVKWDENKNLYTVSHYGWTVDKWAYSGTLPTITLTGVEEVGGVLPVDYALSQNYPNPFNPTTTIEFGMPHSGEISLKVYSVLGQEVATLVDGMQAAGVYRVTFDAQGLASGTYFSILRAEGTTIVKQMMLVR